MTDLMLGEKEVTFEDLPLTLPSPIDEQFFYETNLSFTFSNYKGFKNIHHSSITKHDVDNVGKHLLITGEELNYLDQFLENFIVPTFMLVQEKIVREENFTYFGNNMIYDFPLPNAREYISNAKILHYYNTPSMTIDEYYKNKPLVMKHICERNKKYLRSYNEDERLINVLCNDRKNLIKNLPIINEQIYLENKNKSITFKKQVKENDN